MVITLTTRAVLATFMVAFTISGFAGCYALILRHKVEENKSNDHKTIMKSAQQVIMMSEIATTEHWRRPATAAIHFQQDSYAFGFMLLSAKNFQDVLVWCKPHEFVIGV